LKAKRKTITAKDVLEALEDMEFDQFVEPLKECLDSNYILIFVTVLQVSPSAITTIVHL